MDSTIENPSNERADRGLRGVTILGSTGSIGLSALDVLARNPARYRVLALTAHTQVDRLFEQCRQYRPQKAVLLDARAAAELKDRVQRAGLPVEVLSGAEGLNTVATHPRAHIVVAAIVGAAGLLPSLAAVRAGKRVLLANKEPLVMSGKIFIDEARASGAELLPVDSEHNAIFQCMPAGYRAGSAPTGVRRIYLTCSGGPFRTLSPEALVSVTPEQACAHPNWVMGRKISVDSATMMNKGLEVIEACFLFNARPEQIEVVIHPQSVVHSMVEYVDGSVLAQLGNPDMRTPIAHGLGFPQRIESGAQRLNFFEVGTLNFEAPDLARFPCLRLAYAALEAGETGPVTLNAANEVAVERFLRGELSFDRIPAVIERVLTRAPAGALGDLAHVLEVDLEARTLARECLAADRAGRAPQLHD